VGAWYTIGLFVGLGVAAGVLTAGLLTSTRATLYGAAALAAAVAVGAAFLLSDWPEAIGAGVGALLGALGATPFVRGALRRGGTPGGTALLVGLGALVLAAFALIPVVGYAEAVIVPALAARLRRRAGQTHAGLRILARD